MKRTPSNICPLCDAGDPTSIITECDCERPRSTAPAAKPAMTRCECCDHPLQHAIRAALAMDRAPIPYEGRTHEAIMANLETALNEWEENQ